MKYVFAGATSPAGKPILVAASGEAAALVEAAGAGVTCQPGNPQTLAEAVTRLYALRGKPLEELGRQGRNYYLRELSLAAGVQHFLKLFEEMRQERPRGEPSNNAAFY